MSDLFDAILQDTETEREPYRQAPPGEYKVVVRSAKRVVANSGTKGIELTFTMLEPMRVEGDMDGVDLSRARLRDTVWVTENNVEISRETLKRILPSLRGRAWSFASVIDELPGAEVVVRVDHITTNRDGEPLRIPRLEVKSYYSLDWYLSNRAA